MKILEDEILAIMEQLTGYSQKLEVVSLVGMAGIGKTTLARNVYDDEYIFHHFYVRAWITISQVYQKRDLLLGILMGVQNQQTTPSCDVTDEKLSQKLYQSLKGKRYLIVMAWNDVERCLPDDENGSRVLFTTRNKEVALRANPNNRPHELRFLFEEESWKLFQDKAFPNGSYPLELIDVGKQIVDKCRGLPLSIVVIGGLLSKTEKTLTSWSEVCDRISSYVANDADQWRDTLALSYNHLPDHLKPCFLYLGAFPEDYKIQVSKLVWLWIAEGFIQRTKELGGSCGGVFTRSN